MCTRSLSSRAVDHIDTMLHIVPTLFVDVLRMQVSAINKRVEEDQLRPENSNGGLSTDIAIHMTEKACKAVRQLSRLCEITQQFSVSESEILECDK